MEEYGADRVVVGDMSKAGGFGPFDLIVAAAGSSAPELAPPLLQAGGTCVLYGTATSSLTLVNEPALVERGARVQGFKLFETIQREQIVEGLGRLVVLVETRALQPHIEFEADVTEIDSVTRRIMNRAMVGKAVLHF